MSALTSLRCDHGRPGPDRCDARLDVADLGLSLTLLRLEARRAGWRADGRGPDLCPDHRRASGPQQ